MATLKDSSLFHNLKILQKDTTMITEKSNDIHSLLTRIEMLEKKSKHQQRFIRSLCIIFCFAFITPLIFFGFKFSTPQSIEAEEFILKRDGKTVGKWFTDSTSTMFAIFPNEGSSEKSRIMLSYNNKYQNSLIAARYRNIGSDTIHSSASLFASNDNAEIVADAKVIAIIKCESLENAIVESNVIDRKSSAVISGANIQAVNMETQFTRGATSLKFYGENRMRMILTSSDAFSKIVMLKGYDDSVSHINTIKNVYGFNAITESKSIDFQICNPHSFADGLMLNAPFLQLGRLGQGIILSHGSTKKTNIQEDGSVITNKDGLISFEPIDKNSFTWRISIEDSLNTTVLVPSRIDVSSPTDAQVRVSSDKNVALIQASTLNEKPNSSILLADEDGVKLSAGSFFNFSQKLNEVQFELFDRNSKVRCKLGDYDGIWNMSLLDERELFRYRSILDKTGQPSVSLFDGNGKLRTNIGTTTTTDRYGRTNYSPESSIWLFNDSGNSIFHAPEE
jgi:hypothetical protein